MKRQGRKRTSGNLTSPGNAGVLAV